MGGKKERSHSFSKFNRAECQCLKGISLSKKWNQMYHIKKYKLCHFFNSIFTSNESGN